MNSELKRKEILDRKLNRIMGQQIVSNKESIYERSFGTERNNPENMQVSKDLKKLVLK